MKKINNLVVIAIIAIALTISQGCAKTEFHPSYLVGTWTMTSADIKSTNTNETPDDPLADGDLLKRVDESNYNYTGAYGKMNSTYNRTGSSKETRTYDGQPAGSIQEVIIESDVQGEVTYRTISTKAGNITVVTKDTVNTVMTMGMSITFEKDKTFTFTNNSKTVTTSTTLVPSVYSIANNSTNDSKYSASGSWAFIDNDKNTDHKNHERIGLWFSKNKNNTTYSNSATYTDLDAADLLDYGSINNTANSTNTVYENTLTNSSPDMIWEMVEGSDKEMKITYYYTSTNKSNNTSSTTTGSTTTTTTSSSTSSGESNNTITFTK